jgi:hypothetical protein
VVHEEIADELEEEFMEDDRISSNQQALQEVEAELEASENSRYEDVGRMPYRLLNISPEPIAELKLIFRFLWCQLKLRSYHQPALKLVLKT